MTTEQFANNAISTLNGTISSSVTTLVVTSVALFPSVPQFRIIIDSEIMLVTGVSGTTFTVTRGVENTAQASHTNGAAVAMILTSGALDQMRSDLMSIETIGHRLTLTTATPITTSDITGASTLYLTPYKSTKIPLYNGTIWQQFATSEISIVLTITNNSNYDVFAFNNSGVVTLELSSAWVNDTTRNDLLTRQDGVLVKLSNNTRRYLGTIRASGTNTTEDSGVKRFVWNHYNQAFKPAFAILSGTSTSTTSYVELFTTSFVVGDTLLIPTHFTANGSKNTSTGTTFFALKYDGSIVRETTASATSGFAMNFAIANTQTITAGKHTVSVDFKADTSNFTVVVGSSQHGTIQTNING